MRWTVSISTAIALKRAAPDAVQRTDPTKSDVSLAGNASWMNQDVCPLASSVNSAVSSATPSVINRQVTSIAASPALCRAAAVLIPPARRRATNRTSRRGRPAPVSATPTFGSK